MKFIWNEVKRQSNLKKHAIDFVNAEKVFVGSTLKITVKTMGNSVG
jgi:uncharacterized DUF497 family protein